MAAKLSALVFLVLAAVVSGQYEGQVEVSPRSAVIVRGGNVSMVCKVAYPIDSCRVRVAGRSLIMRPDRPDPTSNINYKGNGLQSGECGVEINRVDESMNGNITCAVPSQSGLSDNENSMQLIIAKAPEEPILHLSPGSISQYIFRDGDTLRARCDVRHGRPHAKISWFLGGEQLLEGLHQVTIIDEPNSDLKTISQNLTREVKADDDGKSLECKAEHAALSSPMSAQRQLVVQYPPQLTESGSTITIFGLRLNERGLLNVTVRANPPPEFSWAIGDTRLRQGDVDHEDKYEAKHLQSLGQGLFVAALEIRNVEKSDVDRQYVLTASNHHGQQDFFVRISTSEEPEAVQLDAGSIVGIIIAVLVVLIAVSLLLFARATHRWCFAGPRDNAESRPRSSGESSDTESAVAGPKASTRRLPDLSRALPALRSVLPTRGRKDKVVAESQPPAKPSEEEKPLQEGDKKSVVYAELALATPADAAPAKPNPDAAEYAEIAYGEQPPKSE